MICRKLGSTHGFGDTNITLVSLSHYNVVNEMPVLTSWMHPRGFLVVSRVTTKFKIGKKSGKSREFDFQAKSREKVVNFVESLEKVVNFGQIA